jgi:ribonuclease Z
MFDCGPAATHKLIKAGLSPTQIDYLFFTHHHFDHDADYACFVLTRWCHIADEKRQLHVWGPPPTEWITERLIGPDGAHSADWKARLEEWSVRPDAYSRRGAPTVDVHDVGPGKVVETKGWSVTAARAKHQEPALHTLAYRVDSDEGSIVFCADTLPCESVSQLAHRVDALVVTCWDHQEAVKARPYPLILSGTLDVANLAREADVKRLILTHPSPSLARPGSNEKAIVDISRVFRGEIIFGEESLVLDL